MIEVQYLENKNDLNLLIDKDIVNGNCHSSFGTSYSGEWVFAEPVKGLTMRLCGSAAFLKIGDDSKPFFNFMNGEFYFKQGNYIFEDGKYYTKHGDDSENNLDFFEPHLDFFNYKNKMGIWLNTYLWEIGK